MKNQTTQAADNPYADYLDLDGSEEPSKHTTDVSTGDERQDRRPAASEPGWVNANGARVESPYSPGDGDQRYQATRAHSAAAAPASAARRVRPATASPASGSRDQQGMGGVTKLIIWGSVGLTVLGICAVLAAVTLSSGSGKRASTLSATQPTQALPQQRVPADQQTISGSSPPMDHPMNQWGSSVTNTASVDVQAGVPSGSDPLARGVSPYGSTPASTASSSSPSGAMLAPLPVSQQPVGTPLEGAAPSPTPNATPPLSATTSIPALQPFADLTTVISVFNYFRQELLSQRERLDRIEGRLANLSAPTTADGRDLDALKNENDKLTTQLKKLDSDNENLSRMLVKLKGENRDLRSQITSLREKTQAAERRVALPGWEVVGLTDTHVALIGPQNAMRVVKVGEQFSGVTILSVNTETGVVRTDAGEMRYAGTVYKTGQRPQ